MNEKEEEDNQPKFQIGNIQGGIINVGGRMTIDEANLDSGKAGLTANNRDEIGEEVDGVLMAFRRKMVAYLSLEDIRTACFDLGINYDNLPGETLNRKVIELLKYCQRRDKLDSLRVICRELNGAVDW